MRAATALLLCTTQCAALAPRPLELRFDHVQIFADAVAPVETYAAVEAQAGAACAALRHDGDEAFDSTNRDVVAQLLWALQWRVVAHCATSVVVAASHDEDASTFVITGPHGQGPAWASHERWAEARDANAGRASVGCLAFRCVGETTIDDVHASYLETHPALIKTKEEGMLEAYAYYDGDGPDFGTVLRLSLIHI